MIRRLEVAIFAVAFALAGLVTFAFLWSGDGPYAWLANANGVTGMTYVSHDPCPPPAGGCFGGGQVSVEVMRAWDAQWVAYVTGAQTDACIRATLHGALLFHEVFFPQGNFLFDPASSNLIRLYPDWYWQGITGLVAGSVVAVGGVVAGTCALALRRLRAR